MVKLKKNKKEEIEVLEFEENQKKSKIKDIKEFLKDKRNKAIVKLSIYGVFILIVVIYIRFTNSNNRVVTPNNNDDITEVSINTITDKLKLLNQNKDYSFTINYDITETDNIYYSVSGNHENNITSINLYDQTYYYEDNNFYTLINGLKDYVTDSFINDMKYFFPKNIYKYLLKANYQYKKEDLNSNITINSLLNVSEFALINNNIVSSDSNIVIETTENDSNTITIYLDMTNYYNLYNGNITKYLVTIELKY